MLKIQLFLASSVELKADREQFVIFINRKNKLWAEKQVFLELIIWEDFLDAMSRTSLQDEYNKVIRECDLFVLLIATKIGKYKAEEFDVAFGQFKVTNRPLIFTYFKNTLLTTASANKKDLMSLWAFQKKLKKRGHFCTQYDNPEGLCLNFSNELDKLVEKGFIKLKTEENSTAGEKSEVVNQTAEKIYNIDKIDKAEFKTIINQYQPFNQINENEIEFSLEKTIAFFQQYIEEGKLNQALQEIDEIIQVDDIKRIPKYYEKLSLLKAQIIWMLGLVDQYKLQIRMLEKLSSSFEKFYRLLRMMLILSPQMPIDAFLKKFNLNDYVEEIKICYELINNVDKPDFGFKIETIQKFCEDSKSRIIKLVLNYFINTNKPEEGILLYEMYPEYCNDHEAKFMALINRINLILKSPRIELSVTQISQLKELEKGFFELKNYIAERHEKAIASFHFNYAIIKILINDSTWKDSYQFFKNNEKFVATAAKVCARFNKIETALEIIENSNVSNSPQVTTELVNIKINQHDYQFLASLDYNNKFFPNEIQAEIISAKNIVTYDEKQQSFTELDLHFLADDKDNIIVYSYISKILYRQKNYQLAEKYFYLAYNLKKQCTEHEKFVLAELAYHIDKYREAKLLCEMLIPIKPAYKKLYLYILMEKENNFNRNIIELNNFFNSIDIKDDLPLLLYRKKVEYHCYNQEFDKAIDLQEWITFNFDFINDWFNFIMLLIDQNKFQKIHTLISHLATKTENPLGLIILCIISICDPNKMDETKLEEFTRYFFLAFKMMMNKKMKIGNPILHRIWIELSQRQLFINKTIDYVDKNTSIKVQKKNTDLFMTICIHSSEILTCPYIEEYLGSKHIYLHDDAINDLMYKCIDDEVAVNKDIYIIKQIDSLWNYPMIFLNTLILANPQDFGIKLFNGENEYFSGLISELDHKRNLINCALEDYSNNKITLFLLSTSDYKNYLDAIFNLFNQNNLYFYAGRGRKYQAENYAISYSSLLLMAAFDKLKFLPLEKFIISKSLLSEIEVMKNEFTENIDIEKYAIKLNQHSAIDAIKKDKNYNLEIVQKWNKFFDNLKLIQVFDTIHISDEFTPFIRFFGKLEVDALRVAKSKSIPLIIDDDVVQVGFKYPILTNIIPFYFQESQESILEKLIFLDQLSKFGYCYLIYENFIFDCISSFIRNAKIILGSNTPVGIFLRILKREFNIRYKYLRLYDELIKGLKLLIDNFLNPGSEIVLIELLKIFSERDKDQISYDLLSNFSDSELKSHFIRYCFNLM